MLRLKSPGRRAAVPVARASRRRSAAPRRTSPCRSRTMGVESRFVSAIPANNIGDACIGELRRHGVDTQPRQTAGRAARHLLPGERREPAPVEGHVRSRRVVDRHARSRGDFDWDAIFDGADWFHVTGVTPAISAVGGRRRDRGRDGGAREGTSPSPATTTTARISGSTARRRRRSCASWCVSRRRDRQRGGLPEGARHRAGRRTCTAASSTPTRTARSPSGCSRRSRHLEKQVITLRESHSADLNGWSAVLHNGKEFLDEPPLRDHGHRRSRRRRGLVRGRADLRSARIRRDDQTALEFATAASCLKHSIPGDFNRVSVAEVEALMRGDASGRVQR